MADILNQTYQMTPTKDLTPYPGNPRLGNIGVINDSVETNGFYGALVVQRSTGYVLVGNHRLLVAQAQGLDTVPVIWVDVDDERAARILAVDNRSADLAEWDDRRLYELLGEMPNLDGTGFTGEELEEIARSTGILGEQASAFMNDYLTEDDDEDPDDGPHIHEDGERFFTLAYTVTPTERDVILAALRDAKEAHTLDTSAQALALVCKAWMAQRNPVSAG